MIPGGTTCGYPPPHSPGNLGLIRTIAILWLTIACCVSPRANAQMRKTAYAGYPNHIEIADRALQLAMEAGFDEPGLTADVLRARLECGAYDEDYAVIPGTVGDHFPSPWTKGPDFPFNGALPFTKIPYGVLTDPWSGWYRGLAHGYDPLTGFMWPGAIGSTVEWANSKANAFSWDNAVALYASGHIAEAYECLGHVLHLLMDLSVPAHVKVVNHGSVYTKKASGYAWDPDLVSITIDEYEMALSGGLESNFLTLIPDLHGIFTTALAGARVSGIPAFATWSDYLRELALTAAHNSVVLAYYRAPDAQGNFGRYLNGSGGVATPVQLGTIIGPGQIGDRYTQVAIYCTATLSHGCVIPHGSLEALCDSLVPRAAEFSAGLILLFRSAVATGIPGAVREPESFTLLQNYPNPFNPTTTIRYSLPHRDHVRVTVTNTPGQTIATLVDRTEEEGYHEVRFDARGLPSGVYPYTLESGTLRITRRAVLVR